MIPRDDAGERQVRAADPARSTWLSANAGSGKTRVLTDRVARLLLGGTEPQRILCLTYTKAAATEMQNRLFQRLGRWAMLPDPGLRDELRALGAEGGIDADRLAQARRLFARAIETPGGLKIQTIHSFCAGLLRRFPLEAGISPDFREMDDRAAELLREDIIAAMAESAEVALVDDVAMRFTGEQFGKLLADICRNSVAFCTPMTAAAAEAAFGLRADYDAGSVLSDVFLGGEAALIAALVPVLAAKGGNDARDAQKLAQIGLSDPGLAELRRLEGVLLFASGARANAARIGNFPTKPTRDGPAAHLMPALEALMARVEAARPLRLACEARERSEALGRFARAFLMRYETAKAQRSWLDFDDLISRASALLSDRSVAQWVLFRLDGGIDHMLVDEAQDTSPGQWRVIGRLAEEFTAGEGAHSRPRTIFVVGDKKQSIYSFQGADLAEFDKMQAHFRESYRALGTDLQESELAHSFRSATAVLRVVDMTFDGALNRGLGGRPAHIAYWADKPGRVDLWEPIARPEGPDEKHWYDPVDILAPHDEKVILAQRIAAQIRRMIDTGVKVPTRDGIRPMHEGDVLILVQRRSALFAEIIRACKQAGLAIAGADRLRLGGELAVRDLGALLSFLATPEDDLSLAAALRSPLFGWTEAQLYNLAQGRAQGQFLWAALRNCADCPGTLDMIGDLLANTDFLRPYDLIERILTRWDGRRRLLARLGPEAEDGIDTLLAQALAFERSEIPSLTGFLVWMQTDDVEVKRRMESGGHAIRVMTVHGAKGLEAPVVILPDTHKPGEQMRQEILTVAGQPVWRPSREDCPPAILAEYEAVLQRQREERLRLLYVAMTRAESWLIVCAAGDVGSAPEDSWYQAIRAGMVHAGAVTAAGDGGPLDFGAALRVESGDWPAAVPVPDGAARSAGQAVALPDWTSRRAAPPDLRPSALPATALGGAKAVGGAGGDDADAAMLHGTRLHLLLEHLPHWPPGEWPGIAESLLATGDEPALLAETETLLAEATAVLTCGQLKPWLARSLAEVEVTGPVAALGGRVVHGTVDLLSVTPDKVVVIDYKSNLGVPATPDAVPEGILRQMGAYDAILSQTFPGRSVETAILWTRTGLLMPLPPDIVRAALARTTIP